MATCLDLAGAPRPQVEGKSLVPAFENKPLDREALYWEHEGNRAIRAGDWKLVAKGPGGPWELYDLAHDRIEANNLASGLPELVAELSRKWEAWARRTQVLPWIWKPPYEPNTRREAAPQ
jgi:arylsulfatase